MSRRKQKFPLHLKNEFGEDIDPNTTANTTLTEDEINKDEENSLSKECIPDCEDNSPDGDDCNLVIDLPPAKPDTEEYESIIHSSTDTITDSYNTSETTFTTLENVCAIPQYPCTVSETSSFNTRLGSFNVTSPSAGTTQDSSLETVVTSVPSTYPMLSQSNGNGTYDPKSPLNLQIMLPMVMEENCKNPKDKSRKIIDKEPPNLLSPEIEKTVCAKSPDITYMDYSVNKISQVLNKKSSPSNINSGNDKKENSKVHENDKNNKTNRQEITCPVCFEVFKSKRSFNSHIIVHCRLVNGTGSNTPSLKRVNPHEIPELEEVKRIKYEYSELNTTEVKNEVRDYFENNYPLDLSCPQIRNSGISSNNLIEKEDKIIDLDSSILSDRSLEQDEKDNLVNEAREREKLFFDSNHNDLFLAEDSTGIENGSTLPLIMAESRQTKTVKVSSDDGPPMVYKIKLHAEQMLISRILGTNEETGDKIELYKCYTCGIAFPSISRMQAHLVQHKQKFICRKCNYTCDSRSMFSDHIQKEHLTDTQIPITNNENSSSSSQNSSDISNEEQNNPENAVTVAALLSALRVKSQDINNIKKDEDTIGNGSFTLSPTESQHTELADTSTATDDIFKMYTCRFCGKKFDRAFSCNRHERVHTGFKPCFCGICGRGFSEPRNLRHHVIRFHSDGTLRHLIKRDRRKRKNSQQGDSLNELIKNEGMTQILKETNYANVSPTEQDNMWKHNLTNTFSVSKYVKIKPKVEYPHQIVMPTSTETIESMTTSSDKEGSLSTNYDSNLNKIVGETLSNSKGSKSLGNDVNMEKLEPGEVRLGIKTKIIDDGVRGRRIVSVDEQSEDNLDHSPHFSSYAPRLNIVEEPVDRNKALFPITDDIGRTFFECPYCRKLFGSTSDMNRHLDFHEDLRPYNCEYCDYSARTNSQLKVHKMRHEGIKKHSCDVCNYNGVTQSDLNRHKKTQSHMARSKNVCNICGLGFYTSAQNKVHIIQCHPEVEGAASSLIEMSMGAAAPTEFITQQMDSTVASQNNMPGTLLNIQ